MLECNVMEREAPIEVFFCDDTMLANIKPPYPTIPENEREEIRREFEKIMKDYGL